MRGLDVSRRGLMAGALASGAAFRLGRAAAQGGPGGPVLVVAADSEPRNLNPAIVASNGVFYVRAR